MALRLLAAKGINIGDGDALDIGLSDGILQVLLAAVARADHADANAIVRAQHAGVRKGGKRQRPRRPCREIRGD